MKNDEYSLAYKKIDELEVLAGGSIASGDYIPVWDASAGEWKKVDATYFAAA